MDTSDCFAHTLEPYYFASYEELKNKMKEFEVACGVQYTIKRSIRLADDVANRNIFVYKYIQYATGCLLVKRNSIRYPDSAPEHETLVYKSITYACCHYGNGRSLSIKTQQQKKINCPCIVRIGCRGKKLHIIGFVMRHNHPVTTELAETYPENRRLTEDEKLEINDFLQSAPDNLTVKEHIERKFGKPCTLNDVRQMKYRLRKLQKSDGASHGQARVVSSRHQNPTEADFDFDPIPPVSDWVVHPKGDYRLSQFEPLSNQLADLVCSADQETFCDRIAFLKELTEAWRGGKQPMLAYSESMIKGDSCESPINTEVVTSENPFPYSKLAQINVEGSAMEHRTRDGFIGKQESGQIFDACFGHLKTMPTTFAVSVDWRKWIFSFVKKVPA
ncbi:hypothetical protein EGR_00484 [Echinococcus granulosus]|uniref:FAR1 domain-containing protein n=1 Tax=Echinococcus granulosus TaxID=6210 RepID=W6VCD7_ECHGR|nr:hypothetical protein EGR_00484 [Echinococcus granulosus]EUB64534.1 hypothetical protein EGR_00484 [Echinococcus granulosus]